MGETRNDHLKNETVCPYKTPTACYTPLEVTHSEDLPYMNRWKKCQQSCQHQAGSSMLVCLDQTCQCNTGHWSVSHPA